MIFTKPQRKKLYREAVNKWGMALQLGMLIEESAELIQSIHKIMRKGEFHNKCMRKFVSEVADVEIMIEQIKTVWSYHELEKRINQEKNDKLLRLKKMIENDKEM